MRYLLLVSKLIVSLFNKCVHFYKYNAVYETVSEDNLDTQEVSTEEDVNAKSESKESLESDKVSDEEDLDDVDSSQEASEECSVETYMDDINRIREAISEYNEARGGKYEYDEGLNEYLIELFPNTIESIDNKGSVIVIYFKSGLSTEFVFWDSSDPSSFTR